MKKYAIMIKLLKLQLILWLLKGKNIMYWVNESVFYHIYPLGFCGAPRINDGNLEYRLDKVVDFIPHLKEMNVNAVYFGPVFMSTTHGYDTNDYYNIDNRLGDNDSFAKI